MNNGDTAWLLVSAVFVMLMTPGLAMFYGGMVRKKNILDTIMQSFIVIGVIRIEWMLVGYGFAFGPDHLGVIGDFTWFALSGVGSAPFKGYAPTVPYQAFMIYQMMFAVITPALISGAGTWALFKFLDWTIGLRVTEDKEILGLDLSEHGEAGYN